MGVISGKQKSTKETASNIQPVNRILSLIRVLKNVIWFDLSGYIFR
jgi:hypothetical protein